MLYQSQALIERDGGADTSPMDKFRVVESATAADIIRAKLRAALEFAPTVSDKALAAACDITPQAVSGWRSTGRISKRNLPIVASMTGTALEWWLDGRADSPPVAVERDLAPKASGTNGGLSAQEPLDFYGDPKITRLIEAYKKLSTADQMDTLASLEQLAERTQAIYAELRARESPAAAAFGTAVSDHEVERRMKLGKNRPS